ncbi:alpha/beta hydrolase [Hymenobacter guriensis]|uniref:alpha/beta hydrolase n=1 Tax=Hymenobacter guriensis TaxID=2793065 RepID=UPI00293D81BB|nr:hypothetical protein [Hymenobacter guriensis]
MAYLNQLTESLLAQVSADVRVTVLGFSQGSATVGRWLVQARFRPARLVLWAGAFPPDVDFSVASYLARRVPITLVCGTHDQYISEADFAAQQDFLHGLGCTPTVLRFDGGHELNANVLRQLHAEA